MEKFFHILKALIPKKLYKILQPPYHFILSWLAALVYRFPSKKLIVIGVTGTTGKTTVVYLIYRMLREAGFKCGFTSTALLNNGDREWLNNKKMTMIGRFFTQKMLRQMLNNGCRFAIIETTSEGIAQYRHRFINYDVLVFTGLYSEHIDSHGSFENYKQAKGRLFAHLKRCSTKYIDEKFKVKKAETGFNKIALDRVKKVIIANGDDEHAEYFLNFFSDEKIIVSERNHDLHFGKENIRAMKISDIQSASSGTSFKFNQHKIDLGLLGDFNAMNAGLAIASGLSQGLDIKKIKKGLEAVRGIPGRLEKIQAGQQFTVIVDYAFEPNAVAKLYDIIEKIEHNRIIHVLGSAGGGRDIARRPKLGKLAGAKADYAIITNEDPYDDDPNLIIDQVALGAENAGKKPGIDLFKIQDRTEAIKKALFLAGPGDIVLLTGKGCEQAICVANNKKINWDDRQVVRKLIKAIK